MVSSVHLPAGLAGLGAPTPLRDRAGAAADAAGGAAVRREADEANASPAAAVAAAREGVSRAIAALDVAQTGGRAALEALSPPLSREGLGRYAARLEDAIAAGGGLLRGDALTIGGAGDDAPLEITGADLRLPADLAAFARGEVSLPEERVSKGVEELRSRAAETLDRLATTRDGLGAHAALLQRLESAVAGAVRGDLDADGARLAALSVSQSLSQRQSGIAEGGAQAILASFRN